jgi:hypothetical protein
MRNFWAEDWVCIDASGFGVALVEALGRGRYASYTGRVVEVRGERVSVAVDGAPITAPMWFDASVLSKNPQISLV